MKQRLGVILVALGVILASTARAQAFEYAEFRISQERNGGREYRWESPDEHAGPSTSLEGLFGRVEFVSDFGPYSLAEFLNGAGGEGWELVTVVVVGSDLQYVFKRAASP